MEAAVGAHRRAQLLGRKAPAVAGQPARLQAGVHRRAAELGDHDVRRLLDDELGAALAEDRERDLVAHRRGREVDRLLLAEQLGAAALELEDGRVLALLLVADLGAPPSPRASPCDGFVCVSERRSITSRNLTAMIEDVQPHDPYTLPTALLRPRGRRSRRPRPGLPRSPHSCSTRRRPGRRRRPLRGARRALRLCRPPGSRAADSPPAWSRIPGRARLHDRSRARSATTPRSSPTLGVARRRRSRRRRSTTRS